MAIADIANRLFKWRYEIGSLVLVFLVITASFIAGSLLGFEGAELWGYSVGPLSIVLIVVGLSRLWRRTRTRSATAKIVFFTLLVVLFGTSTSLIQVKEPLPPLPTQLDEESLTVDHYQANALAVRIQDSVSRGETNKLETLYDGDQFMTRILRGQDTTSRYLRDIARGGTVSFKQGNLLEEMASLVKQGGEFTFVKLHVKDREPILQFRLTEESGNLHYLDLYIFKTRFGSNDGNLRIDDLHYYNSGDRLSRQVLENAIALTGYPGSSSTNIESVQKAVQLTQKGKVEEGYAVLESLPDEMKQQRMVMRLRVHWALQVGLDQAESLLNDFKKAFPDDPGIVFSAFTGALAKNDLSAAAGLIDDIYKAVDGDEYLLWYKANLFLMQKKYQDATSLLSKMENEFNIDAASLAKDNLPEEFLRSREYKSWLTRHRKIK
jgi:hypothetical protein